MLCPQKQNVCELFIRLFLYFKQRGSERSTEIKQCVKCEAGGCSCKLTLNTYFIWCNKHCHKCSHWLNCCWMILKNSPLLTMLLLQFSTKGLCERLNTCIICTWTFSQSLLNMLAVCVYVCVCVCVVVMVSAVCCRLLWTAAAASLSSINWRTSWRPLRRRWRLRSTPCRTWWTARWASWTARTNTRYCPQQKASPCCSHGLICWPVKLFCWIL